MLVLKVPCAARGAEQAVELSAPWPAGRAPSARELSLSVCRHLARACLCVVVLWKRARLLE